MTESQAIEMPRFDFSNVSFKTQEELEAHDKANGGGTRFVEKYFKPGQYDVTITSIDCLGKAQKDDSWVNLVVHYQGTGEKTINGLIQIPTRDVKYGPRGTTYPYRVLQEFCKALGHNLTVETLGQTVKSLFSRPEKLAGTSLRIAVGYAKGYAKYAGKRDDGTAYFVLMDRNHESVKDDSGLDLQFGDKTSAELYAQANKIPFDKYTQVLGFAASPRATNKADDDIF